MHAAPLAAMLGGEAMDQLEVMSAANAASYWSCSDAFSMVIESRRRCRRARGALPRRSRSGSPICSASRSTVAPAARIEDADWRWFVGLDAEATAIGNRLWKGEAVDPTRSARICGLFRLDFADSRDVVPELAGKPVYLIMALDEDMILRVKPQNLVVGLPLAGLRAA